MLFSFILLKSISYNILAYLLSYFTLIRVINSSVSFSPAIKKNSKTFQALENHILELETYLPEIEDLEVENESKKAEATMYQNRK